MERNKRNLTLALILAVCSCAFCAAQDTGKTIRHHKVEEQSNWPAELTHAEAAIEKNDLATAEPLLKKVVADDPANYQAWFDLGFVYNRMGRSQDSIDAYRKSVAAKPDVFESNLNLGLMLAKTGQPDAEQFLRTATGLTPTANVDEGRARAWLSLAHVIEKSKPGEAIEAYRKAAELTPKDPEPHLSAGQLLEKENRFADAEQEYKQGLALDPNSADATTGLANIYIRGNRLADAEEMLKKIIAKQPDNLSARMQLGRILLQAGRNEEAITELEAALKMAPGNAELQSSLAGLYATTKKYDRAEALYRSMLAHDMGNAADLHYALGTVYMNQRRFPEAQQEFLAAVQLKPDFGEAYGDLAVVAVENKNYELAIKAVDARAKVLPEIPVAYFLRATAYDHLRDYKLAAENYRKFLDVANGKFPDQEWQARHRLIAIDPKNK